MSDLRDLLQAHVSNGSVPGVVALVARGGQADVAAAGFADIDGTSAMARDSIFRIASITKPIIAAATMMLVEDGHKRPPRAPGSILGHYRACDGTPSPASSCPMAHRAAGPRSQVRRAVLVRGAQHDRGPGGNVRRGADLR